MNIDILELILSKYPKLSKAYSEKIEKDYTLVTINTEDVALKETEGCVIKLVMENKIGDTILLNYSKFKGSRDSISVIQLPNTKKQIHPNLLLNSEHIREKEFRTKLFGGYDTLEVNSFLDLIIKDYQFIEKELIKENDILKINLPK
ncbi:DivIVA domain-containing protein [Neobacillus sp.]|uniref:DivIVA domain-containing protein n=1 Tax=Neobacillus sp. TaxID=2675273 RepID=UPI0028974B3B|nr:DivIVA domain-containing protein [Neobacillus sp.]